MPRGRAPSSVSARPVGGSAVAGEHTGSIPVERSKRISPACTPLPSATIPATSWSRAIWPLRTKLARFLPHRAMSSPSVTSGVRRSARRSRTRVRARCRSRQHAARVGGGRWCGHDLAHQAAVLQLEFTDVHCSFLDENRLGPFQDDTPQGTPLLSRAEGAAARRTGCLRCWPRCSRQKPRPFHRPRPGPWTSSATRNR